MHLRNRSLAKHQLFPSSSSRDQRHGLFLSQKMHYVGLPPTCRCLPTTNLTVYRHVIQWVDARNSEDIHQQFTLNQLSLERGRRLKT